MADRWPNEPDYATERQWWYLNKLISELPEELKEDAEAASYNIESKGEVSAMIDTIKKLNECTKSDQ